jgi:hypothetical protein
VRDLAMLQNFFALLSRGSPRSNLLAAIAGSYSFSVPLLGSMMIGPVQPDVDVDCDGLERINATPGDATTAPTIVSCVDGDGTVIPGPMCWADPRIRDGYSSAFQVYGVFVHLVGTAP